LPNIHAAAESSMNTGGFAQPAWNLAISHSELHNLRTMRLWTGCTQLKTKELKSQNNH